MPINQTVLTRTENVFVLVDFDITVEALHTEIQNSNTVSWTYIIAKMKTGNFGILSIRQFYVVIEEMGDLIWYQVATRLPLGWLPLQTKEQAEIGTREAEKLASQLEPQVLGVLNDGKLIGVINKSIHRSSSSITVPDAPSTPIEVDDTSSKNVHFTVFVPEKASSGVTFSAFAYIHLDDLLDEVNEDISDFIDRFDGEIPQSKTARQTSTLALATKVTVEVVCDDLESTPVRQTKRWRGSMTRYAFKLKALPNLEDEPILIQLRFLVNEIEIARTRSIVTIQASDSGVDSSSVPDKSTSNVLHLAKMRLQKSTMTAFQKIFISYSRKDKEVVMNYYSAQIALGNEVFLDTESIRTGEDWQAALANGITNAEVLQLFWSENSAASKNVEDEWKYALKHVCAASKCVNFIRPVYWQQNLTTVPSELGHLNFRYVNFAQTLAT